MCPKWRGSFDHEEPAFRSGSKIEKIRKEKRSVRGRVVDDWYVDANKKSESEFLAELDELLKTGLRRGRVIEVHKKHIFVAEETAEGEPDTAKLWLCTVAKRHFQRAHKERNFVVVGDRILFQPDIALEMDNEGEPIGTDLPRGIIQHSFQRKTRLARKDPLHPEWEHVMLANIDLMVIVASVLHPEVRWGLIDRMLVQAEMDAIPLVIVLNKVDLLKNPKLASPEFLETYQRRLEIYRGIGYEVVEVCALKPKKTPDAVKHLRSLFKGKLIGFCGHSGVGKSSIVNLMKPEFEQIVDDDPEIFYKGRHTTTYNSLLRLGIGAYAIDTPGVRSFDTETEDPITLSACFREFAGLKCRYRECSHTVEPGCGVLDALEKGRVSKERYRSFVGILKGITFREGDAYEQNAAELADLKAREFARDNLAPIDLPQTKPPQTNAPQSENESADTLSRAARLRMKRTRKTTGETHE
jgi:ribosome biogenesis GTPase